MLYRSMGHLNEAGGFVPPISYIEAQSLPKRMIELFLNFDDIADKIPRQMTKQKGKR